jgi:hypothetical protein
MPFSVPIVWREQKDHSSDCHFCFTNITGISTTSGFHNKVGDKCTHLAANSGNYLTTFRDNLTVPPSRVKNLFGILTLEDAANRKNIIKQLPLLAV